MQNGPTGPAIDGVVVTPALVKRAPAPRRIVMGDLSRTPGVLAALDLLLPPPAP